MKNSELHTLKKKNHTPPYTVLLVEDEPLLQMLHIAMLQKFGYKVDFVSSGENAFRLYQKKNYSAILLDLGLPDISGQEVMNKIRQYEKRQSTYTHIPIIIATAGGAPNDDKIYLSEGASAYFNKPISKKSLRDTLSHLIHPETAHVIQSHQNKI